MQTRLTLRLAAAVALAAPALLGARPDGLAAEAQRHLDARVYDLGLSRDHTFALKNVFEERSGEAHVRMRQFYKGVRVMGGEAIVHLVGGQVYDRTDALVRGLSLNVTPALGRAEALAAADRALAPKGAYASAPTAELVIAQVESELTTLHGSRTVTRPVLAYHIHTELENAQETRHTDFLVDAHTGAVLESWNTLHTAGASGTGNSQYSGTVAINTNSTSSGT